MSDDQPKTRRPAVGKWIFVTAEAVTVSAEAESYITQWLSHNNHLGTGETACIVHCFGGEFRDSATSLVTKLPPRIVLGVFEKVSEHDVVVFLKSVGSVIVRIPVDVVQDKDNVGIDLVGGRLSLV